MRWVLTLTGLVGAVLGLTAPARGQDNLRACEFVAPSGEYRQTVTGGTVVVRITTPHLVCADGVRLQSDSVRFFEATSYYQFFGNVFFQDTIQTLRSRDAQLDRRQGLLQAQGDVRLEREDGSRIMGESLVHEQLRGDRTERLTVQGGQPNAILYPRRAEGGEGAGAPPPADSAVTPYDITASSRIVIEGQTRFRAVGDVVIVRGALTAFGDEADLDQDEGVLNLLGSRQRVARMTGDQYDLEGEHIRAVILLDVVRQVVARRRARLIGSDLVMRAPLITLDMTDGVLERLHAQPDDRAAPPADDGAELAPVGPAIFTVAHPPRPVAVAEDFQLVGDEIEVAAPGGVLDSLVATGNARGESLSRDSLNSEDTPEIARRDWMEGRTLTARFTRVEVPDTAAGAAPDSVRQEYRLERLTAETEARSLYRMLPMDTLAAPVELPDSATVADSVTAEREGVPTDSIAPEPRDRRLALHYVTGSRITLILEGGEVRRMEVEGPTRGVHFEPRLRRGGVGQSPPPGGKETP